MSSNRRLNRQAHLGIEVIQELLAYSLRVPPFAMLLRPSQGEFLALSPVNKTSISIRHIKFVLSKRKGRPQVRSQRALTGPALINKASAKLKSGIYYFRKSVHLEWQGHFTIF